MILNASGCLDALEAPEVARALDAFVTKTVTPLPREGTGRCGSPRPRRGMLNSIGLENPGIEGLLAEKLPRLAELGVPLWVSVGGFAASDYAELCAALDDRRGGDDDRAQPLLPERRRGPRERRRDRRSCSSADDGSRSTRSSRPPRRTSPRPREQCRRRGPTGSRS